MSINVGINGLGRIGRLTLRTGIERGDINFTAINDPFMTPEYISYLLRYDTVHGEYNGNVTWDDNSITVNGHKIAVFAYSAPKDIPWAHMGVDYVVESTGVFLTAKDCSGHLEAGAKRVVISAPPKDDVPMFVMGVNHKEYTSDMKIVSNASCTTNCLAPLAKIIDDAFGIAGGLMTTVHSTTSTQKTIDGISRRDWRGGRAAAGNIIPSTTGAAKAVGKVIPHLNGRLTGISMRVPTLDGSVIDLSVNLTKAASYEQLCEAVKLASQGEMAGIVKYTEEPIVSSDCIGNPHTCIFDATAGLSLDPHFAKLIAWYDNEWGYSNKILDLMKHIDKVDNA